MDNWWIVLACCFVAVALHFLVNWKGNVWFAYGNVLLHGGMLVTLLLLETSLEQTFLFLLVSVTANLSIRAIVLKLRQKNERKMEDASSNEN